MAGRRSYDDGCGIARALDVVGDRWALLVIRELLLGPKRFSDLRAGLPGVSANILADRLRELDASGVLVRRKLQPPAGSWVYELTDRGRGLEQVILGLGSWGLRSTSPPDGVEIGVDSVMLSLRSRFAPEAARGLHAEYELRLGEHLFAVIVDDGRLNVARGSADHADAVIETTPHRLDSMVSGDVTVGELMRTGGISVEGDLDAVERFSTLFSAA